MEIHCIGERVVVNFVVGVRFISLFSISDLSEFTVYEVRLDNVMADVVHKLLVIIVSVMQTSGYYNDFLPVQGSADISSDVSFVVASFVSMCRDTFINVVLGGMSFDPGKPNRIRPLSFGSTVEVLP